MLARVKCTYEDGTALVYEEACLGSCVGCSGCAARRKSYLCSNAIGAKPGELVRIRRKLFSLYRRLRKKAGFTITGYPGKRYGMLRE